MATKPPTPKKPGGLAQALPKPVAPKPNRIPGPRPSAQKPPTSGTATPPKGPKGPQGQKPTQNVPPSYKPNWKGDDWKKDSPYKPRTPGSMNPRLPSPGAGTPRPATPKKKPASPAPKPSGVAQKKKK